MTLEFTDEERGFIQQMMESGASFLVHTPRRFVPILLKLQAGKMKAEFAVDHAPIKIGGMVDPRVTWTDDQWLEAAKDWFSREGKTQ